MTRTRNAPGEGNVEPLPSGRFSVRVPVGGQAGRRLPGTYATFEEADAVRRAAVRQLINAGRAAVGGVTLRAFAYAALDRWALRGNRSISDDKNMLEVHIATAHFARRCPRLRDVGPSLEARGGPRPAGPLHDQSHRTVRPPGVDGAAVGCAGHAGATNPHFARRKQVVRALRIRFRKP